MVLGDVGFAVLVTLSFGLTSATSSSPVSLSGSFGFFVDFATLELLTLVCASLAFDVVDVAFLEGVFFAGATLLGGVGVEAVVVAVRYAASSAISLRVLGAMVVIELPTAYQNGRLNLTEENWEI